jgi:hypothetical protein
VQPHLATYFELEHAASDIRIYKISRVHGLLQTEDYARAVFSAARVGKEHPDTEQSVALLMERQRQARASQPRLWAPSLGCTSSTRSPAATASEASVHSATAKSAALNARAPVDCGPRRGLAVASGGLFSWQDGGSCESCRQILGSH